MLIALKKLYEARIAEHSSVIDIYLQKPVGIGEHDKLLEILDERFQKLTCAKDNLKKLEEILNGVQTETKAETKTKTK